MINENINIDKTSQAQEDDLVEVKLSEVELARDWVFWENYQSKESGNNNSKWEEAIKKVVEFSDIISFWQFWNNYPLANVKDFIFNGERLVYFFETKNRVDGLNLFVKGIAPKWEDIQNSGGRILHLLYDIRNDLLEFLDCIGDYWLKLVLLLIGESMPGAKYVSYIIFYIIFMFF